MTGDRVKIVERAGIMIKRIFHKSNPWAGGNCGRDACIICRHERGGGDCKKRNITYKTECLRCLESGKVRQYFGESARTGFERGQEHENDYKTMKEDSHMYKHWLEEHPEIEKPAFSMKVLRGHSTALVRQIHEAVMIEMNVATVLNSKGEFNRCQLPRLGVKMGEKDVQGEEVTREMTENDIFSSVRDCRKRRDERTEEVPRQNKRRKYTVRRPVQTISQKRNGIEKDSRKPGKKMRFDTVDGKCLLPQTVHSCEAVSRSTPDVILTPVFEDNPYDMKTTNKPTLPPALHNSKSVYTENTSIESQIQINDVKNLSTCPSLENPSKLRNISTLFYPKIGTTKSQKKSDDENLSPSQKSKPKFVSPNSVKQMISFFEENAVYKPGENVKNDVKMKKVQTKTKAYPQAKPILGAAKKLKSNSKKSKLCPPPQYNYRKLSEIFPTKVTKNKASRPNKLLDQDLDVKAKLEMEPT